MSIQLEFFLQCSSLSTMTENGAITPTADQIHQRNVGGVFLSQIADN